MKIRFFAVIFILFAGWVGAEDFSVDFSMKEIPGMKIVRGAAVRDGTLKFQNGGNVSFDVDGGEPLKISFRMRVTRYCASQNPPAWNLALSGADGQTGIFRFRQDGVLESYFYKNGQRKGGLIRKFTPLAEGVLTEVTLFLFRNSLSVRIGAEEIGTGRHPGFLPLTSFQLTTYNQEMEFNALALETLPNETLKTVEKPTFALDFENEAAPGFNDRGETVFPAGAANLSFPAGIEGRGLSFAVGNGKLSYELEPPFNAKIGGLMFWVRMHHPSGGQIFELSDGKESKLTCHMGGDRRCRISVKRKDGGKPLDYIRSIPGEVGDWTLIALTWDADSNSKFFINMLPYPVDFVPGQRMPDFMNADVDNIRRLDFLTNPRSGYIIDRVRFFCRTIKNSDVYDEYRRFMPFDMVLAQTVVPAGTPTEITLQAAPGGFYTRPAPVEGKAPAGGVGQFSFVLKNSRGEVLLREKRSLAIDKPVDIRLKAVTLATGSYRLECTVNNAYKRTFAIDSFSSGYRANRSPAGVRTGRLLFSRKFDDPVAPWILKQGELRRSPAGDYLEAGRSKNDRFSIEIPFEKEQLGKPVALDIVWPDDKARMMGWYMYPFGFSVNRDRLQTGVSAGNEFPNSGEMQTTRHIFYPGASKYLFEARTMAPDMPAAVAGQTVLLLKDRPAMRFHDIRNCIDHLGMGNRFPARGSGRSWNHCDLVASDELSFTHHQSHHLTSISSDATVCNDPDTDTRYRQNLFHWAGTRLC